MNNLHKISKYYINKVISFYKNKFKFIKSYSFALIVLTFVSVFLTYFEITQSQLLDVQNPKKAIVLIIIDLILLLILSILFARKVFSLWHGSKYQSGKLQHKIILMFCFVAAIPTIIVTVFSMIFFNFGIHSWFDQRVSTAINESVVVAESYFRTQWKFIESDARIMAQDLGYIAQDNSYGPQRLNNYLSKQADDKFLVDAVIFQTKPQKIVAESKYNLTVPFLHLSEQAITEAKRGNIVIIQGDNDKQVRALIKLSFLPDTYLLVGRNIDVKVLNHVVNTKGAASEYEKLKGQISGLQIQFLIIFLVVALLLLFAAIWLGLTLSSEVIKPLNSLVNATKQITEGDFAVKIKVKDRNDEISVLAKAFNAMALELYNQRQKLIKANFEIQAKHHFSETVISGVSAGVVALDLDGRISVINPTALTILSLNKSQDLKNQDFYNLCPEIAGLLTHAQDFIGHEVKKEIVINRGNKSSILIVRIMTERFLEKTEGYIITFDDITTLVLAQRSAAWADVAKRIAHEIKNPLTPIHLAAERLRKKYSSEVSDMQSFERYLDIIAKHVKDIGMMVEEFVQFARMPAPHFEKTNYVN